MATQTEVTSTVKVTYEGVEYETPEHNYQCIKALTSDKMELYHSIKNAPTPAIAKCRGQKVPYNPIWEGIKPEVMYKIQLAKHEQHPDLADDLCTYDGKFLEASMDRFWGTGTTIMDPTLDTGEFGGRNELGRVLNRVWQVLITRKRNKPNMEMDMDVQLAPHTKDPAHTLPIPAPLIPLPVHDLMNIDQEVLSPATIVKAKSRTTSMEIEVLETDIPIVPVGTE